ncbi:AlkZ-related protein [Nocardioides jensenii]|uniref:AlkZ-related protein n=1 Tax=Nocardioides jensenii TaxID=1843 RepID=UPI00082E2ACE|nr:hypothetical protein [Nocardioides jensenii]
MADGTMSSNRDASLEARRLARWGMDQPPIRTAAEAAAYVDDVGILLLFGDAKASFPSLREVARDENAAMLPAGWGEDLERVWTWKDQFPVEGAAWCGRFLMGRQSLLSPRMLQCLYPGDGAESDFESVELSDTATRVARHLHDHGPTSMRTLRSVHGLDSRASQRILTELGRALVVTNFGTAQDGPGWASGVIELTTRAFSLQAGPPLPDRQRLAATQFVDTMVETNARELGRALRWSRADAERTLDELIAARTLRQMNCGTTLM